MKILFRYLKRYKGLILMALFLASINQVFSLLDPYIYGKLIDKFAHNPSKYTESAFINGVLLMIGALVGTAMISRLGKAFQDYFVNMIIQKVGADIYIDGLRHSLELPFQQFEDQRSGETLNILQKVRIDIEKLIRNIINIFFVTLIGLVFVMVYAYRVHPMLIVVFLVAAVIIGVSTNFLSRKIKKVQAKIVAQTNKLAGSTTESLRNIELIKSLGLTDQESKRLNEVTLRILKLELEKVKSVRSIMFAQGTMVNFLRQAILFVILYLIFKDMATIGQLMTIQMYSMFVFMPLQEMGNLLLSYREAEASLNNYQKIMESPLIPKPVKPQSVGHIQSMEFEDVVFKHRSAHTPALDGVNFTLNRGETIAFVGPSGSGKTTLLKLLVGLYEPYEGCIYYNGIDYQSIDLDEVRAQIGFVTQDTQLFSGTIKENMLFVKPDATDEQIFEALEKASCKNIMNRGKEGINTVIGEGGMKVSGGEKQRLSIARALLRDPRILVFDEATSALDSLTEEEITNTIKEVTSAKDRIAIMIAHRLSTIMHADVIYVLERGRIIEKGRHEELLEEKGLYYAMWRQQIGERKNQPYAIRS